MEVLAKSLRTLETNQLAESTNRALSLLRSSLRLWGGFRRERQHRARPAPRGGMYVGKHEGSENMCLVTNLVWYTGNILRDIKIQQESHRNG